MSNAGFTVNNDTGNIVIDSELKNLSLRYKGYVIAAQGTPTKSVDGVFLDYPYTFQVQLTMRNPVIAIRPDSSTGPRQNSSDWATAENIAMVSRLEPLGGDVYNVYFWYSGSFTYYVFDDPQPGNDKGTAGLQVWNSQGDLCFSSAFQYMRVIGSFVGNFDSDGAYRGVNHVPESPGRSYALVQSRVHMYTSKLAEPVAHQKYGLLDHLSFVVRSPGFGIGLTLASTHFGGFNYSNNVVIPGIGKVLLGSALIVDVTGY